MTLPWYRRFPDRFIAGTIHLSLEEKGAYSLLLDMMYVRGGPIPDEPRHIAGVLNCSVRKWNIIRQKLIDTGKIATADGHLMNFKAEEEIAISGKISQEAAENGAKGGHKSAQMRAEAKKTNALAQADGKLSISTTNKKELASPDAPTEGLVLHRDRAHEEALWRACEEAMGAKVKPFLSSYRFPEDIVLKARAKLEQARAGPLH